MRAELLRRTGMAPPRPLVEIATKFAERGGNIAQGLELFEDTVDMRLCHCIDDRYDTMPIEFFPILDTGGDGECFGYVVHAPELQLDDYPMASMVPGENNGVIFAGDTTPIAIENMIARMRDRPEGFDDVDLAWLATIGLRPDRATASRLIGNEWVRPSPQVPDGWSHLMTSDGVGVVARASQFGPDETEPLPRG